MPRGDGVAIHVAFLLHTAKSSHDANRRGIRIEQGLDSHVCQFVLSLERDPTRLTRSGYCPMSFSCVHNRTTDENASEHPALPERPINRASATNASRTRDHSTACHQISRASQRRLVWRIPAWTKTEQSPAQGADRRLRSIQL
jgi:hypothetical protein